MYDDLGEIIRENLKTQAERMGGIAGFCRRTGLNRQLINKYLAGSILPSIESLETISKATGLSIADLVQPSTDRKSALKQLSLTKLISAVKSPHNHSLRFGYYFEFDPTSGSDENFYLSLCYLKQVDGRIRYRRKMLIPIAYAKKRRFWTYDGEAFITEGGVNIIYINSSVGENFGYFKLKSSLFVPNDLFGIKVAITSVGQASPAIYKSYFVYLGEKPNLREEIRRCSFLHTSKSADSLVRKSIELLLTREPVGVRRDSPL